MKAQGLHREKRKGARVEREESKRSLSPDLQGWARSRSFNALLSLVNSINVFPGPSHQRYAQADLQTASPVFSRSILVSLPILSSPSFKCVHPLTLQGVQEPPTPGISPTSSLMSFHRLLVEKNSRKHW